MEAIQVIADLMQVTRQATLRVIDGLTQEEAKWRPAYGANPIGFILWHMVRTQDGFFHRGITPGTQLWEKSGWHERFGLPLGDTGNSYTAEQVESFQVPPLDDLLAYMAEVQESALEIVRNLDSSRLLETPRTDRPDWTVLRYMRTSLTHENQHTGAIEYLRGLAKSR